MKTLVPDEEKLNDVSPPDNDDYSVETEIGAPESIEKVPDLPENYDEEILNHPALCYSSKRLVLMWCIAPHELELEHQSSASFPMICTVSL